MRCMLMLMLYSDCSPWELGDRFVISVHFLCSMGGVQSWNWCSCPRGELQDPSLKNALEKFLTVILNLSRLNVTYINKVNIKLLCDCVSFRCFTHKNYININSQICENDN